MFAFGCRSRARLRRELEDAALAKAIFPPPGVVSIYARSAHLSD